VTFVRNRNLKSEQAKPIGPWKRYGLVSACVIPRAPKKGATMYTRDVVQTSLLNKLEYCSQQDDTACHLSTQSSDKCNSFVWEKEFSLLRHLHEHEWLLWADCDAVMTNLTLSLDSVTQQAQPGDDLLVIKDHQFYNLGILMIRSSKWSEWFLREMLSLRDWMESMKGAWRDQKALIVLMKKHPDIRSHIGVVERNSLNSYAVFWRTGDLIYHQVNCKPQPDNLKNGYFPKCRELFMEKAKWARETATLIHKLPSSAAIEGLLKTPAVQPNLYERFWCWTRKLGVRHLNMSKPY